MHAHTFVTTAEAAFIATLPDRDINRVADEHLMPSALFEKQGGKRRFSRLSAAFAKFYFDDRNWLMANARKLVLEELTQRVVQLGSKDEVLGLVSLPDGFSWKVANFGVEVDMTPYVADVFARTKEVRMADALVTTHPDTMGGTPVFAGTRVPVDVVLGSLAQGISQNRLKESWPFLTEAHLQAAGIYTQVHPRRGRPRRLVDSNPPAFQRARRLVRPAGA